MKNSHSTQSIPFINNFAENKRQVSVNTTLWEVKTATPDYLESWPFKSRYALWTHLNGFPFKFSTYCKCLFWCLVMHHNIRDMTESSFSLFFVKKVCKCLIWAEGRKCFALRKSCKHLKCLINAMIDELQQNEAVVGKGNDTDAPSVVRQTRHRRQYRDRWKS